MVRMAAEQRKWVGLDCGALPHESTPSLLGRFCSLNGVDRQMLREELGFWMNQNTGSFARGFGVREELLARETGWKLPVDEKTVLTARVELLPWMFSSRFRFCPKCLAGGFHSFWFQLDCLQQCPVHRVQLVDKCLCCGGRAGNYAGLLGHFLIHKSTCLESMLDSKSARRGLLTMRISRLLSDFRHEDSRRRGSMGGRGI
ncbi:TniQ family protein [Paraburkholderia phytofirmans]|uniref:TniQ family protein n=1 Tax=Paraburkholderia phytofirmans TaxID=261302 RepID=UPI0009ECF911